MTTAAIAPIAAIAPSIGALDNVNSANQTSAGQIGTDQTSANQTGATSFGQQLANGLDSLQQAQSNADDLAVSAATGDLTDVHDYLIASTQAQLATQLTVVVRNKAVDAFNEIMRMQA